MQAQTDLLGAVVAHIAFLASILAFVGRLMFGLRAGHWRGFPLLLLVLPLGYMLYQAPNHDRSWQYYVTLLLVLWEA